MEMKRNVRVGGSECPGTRNVKCVEETWDQETAETKHLDKGGDHDERHSLNSPKSRVVLS